jgi:adenylate kinase family enzyme
MMVEELFGIKIEPSEKSSPRDQVLFTAGVRDVLSRILDSEGGKALARSIRYHNKTVLLQPYDGEGCNAQEWHWGTRGETYSTVRFSPGACGSGGCTSPCKGIINASLPHEVLFHELVHSLRRVSGHLHSWILLGKMLNYQDSEEFTAILTTNIFISDVTNHQKSGLRADYATDDALDPALADSFGFFSTGTKVFNLIATFCDENPAFTKMLAHMHARFNPIAAYYHNQRKAFEIAADGDAEEVFGHTFDAANAGG